MCAFLFRSFVPESCPEGQVLHEQRSACSFGQISARNADCPGLAGRGIERAAEEEASSGLQAARLAAGHNGNKPGHTAPMLGEQTWTDDIF